MKYETITNMGDETIIIRTNPEGVVSVFLADESNSDYQAYLAWLEEGNEPEQLEEPEVAPDTL
jgi:hypothetical protein